MNDTDAMKLAIAEAQKAFDAGEAPIGALIIKNDEIISVAHNIRQDSRSPFDHAEILVLKSAAKQLGDWRLSGMTLYVTLEPCPMCLGALFQSRVDRLVFGCCDPKRTIDNFFPSLKDKKDINANNHNLAITGGILEEECAKLLKDFFRQGRERKKVGGCCGFPNDF